MSQKLLANGFEREENIHKFNEHFIKDYDENKNKGYFLEVNVEYPKILLSLQNDLPFLPEGNRIKKCNKLVCDIYNKENYVVHIRALK